MIEARNHGIVDVIGGQPLRAADEGGVRAASGSVQIRSRWSAGATR
jgi:hypothetical protein